MSSRQRKLRNRQPKQKLSPPVHRRQLGRGLRFETMETRHMMAGFLQGFSFVDANNNNIFDTGDAPKVGATIELRNADGSILLGTEISDADGYYRFDSTNISLPAGNLTTGTYRLVEAAMPPGYSSTGVQIDDILSDGSALGTNTIVVKFTALEDSAWVDPDVGTAPNPNPLTVHRLPGLTGVNSAFTLSGAPFNAFTNIADPGNAHQFQLFLSGGALAPDPSASFYSFCMDLFHANPGTYAVTPSLNPTPTGLTTNLGQIGYLYNTYGRQLLSPTDGTGLQLALYELLYDASPNLLAGDFVVNVGGTDAAALTAANAYIAASLGKDQSAVLLNVTPPTPTGDVGRQGMIVTENFNFANRLVQGDLNITITPDDTNEVGVPHTFTVTVQQDLGDGVDSDGNGSAFDPAANAPVTVFLASLNGAGAVPSTPLVGFTDANGQFQVTFSSATAGFVIGNATTTYTVNGNALTRDTDPATVTTAGPGGNGPATKRYVDAKIKITPDDTNEVGVPHTFTVLVLEDAGDGIDTDGDGSTFDPAAGESVAVTLTDTNGSSAVASAPLAGSTDANGQFQVTFSSATAGLVIGNAASVVSVGGLNLSRDTDPATVSIGAGPGGSGPATKRYVDARIKITPNDTNEVGQPHTFTVLVEEDFGDGIDSNGDGSTFDPAAGESVAVTLTDTNGSTAVASTPLAGITDANGQFLVTFSSATAGLVIGNASTVVSVGGLNLTRDTDPATATIGAGPGGSGPATKTYVDAKIIITPDATNAVGDPHTFTVLVLEDNGDGIDTDGDGSTYDAAANESVNVTLTNSNGASASPAGPFVIVTNASGQGSVTFTSSTAGIVTGHASSNVQVGGLSLLRETDGTAGNSGDAVKRFVDAKISIAPDATNAVGDPHTFTVTVMQDDGLTAAQGGDGVTGFTAATVGNVDITLTGSNGAVPVLNAAASTSDDNQPNGDNLNNSGQTTAVFTSNTAGQVAGHATVTLVVGGVTLVRQTDAIDDNTGDAVKTFVDAKISISPNDVNAVGDPHTFTVTVMQDDGLTAAQGGDGVTGFTAATVGNVDVTLTGSNGALPVLNAAASTSDDNQPTGDNLNNSGQTTAVFTSNTAGLVTGHASVSLVVGGVTLVRETNNTAGNSGDALKRFVDARITIGPDATNNVGDPHTFTVTVQQDDGLTAAQGGDGVTGFANVNGAAVDVTLTNQGGAVATPAGPFNGVTNASGQFQVTFNSATSGQIIGNASTTFTTSGVSLTRDTNPTTTTIPAGPGGSGQATKTYVKPGIKMKKYTNGFDADTEADAPDIAPGGVVTWTYIVENTGQTNFAASDIKIVDDAGTPGVPGDDFSTLAGNGTNSQITFQLVVTGDADNILEPGEEWQYKATGIAQTLSGTGGAATTFDFSGSSALDGTDGNIRTFSSGGISVKASAFSRDASGNWATAWLGSYSGGLGVTDSSEGSGASNSHTVDNTGRDNYVLFEFSDIVAIDSAFLGYVVDDSDLRVWIGTVTDPFDNHQTLSDAFLSGLGFTELNDTTLTTTRLADLNAGGVTGNVIIIAANPDEPIESSEDNFKIEKLTTKEVEHECYENYAVVTTGPGGPTSTDLSHYCNPEGAPGIDIKKYTNGYDADTDETAVEIAAGDVVTWTYQVKNTGTIAFSASQIVVSDDAGTPSVTTDDFSTAGGNGTNSAITFQSVLTGDADNILEPGEEWVYKATGIAQDLLSTSGSSQFNFTGSSSTDGTDGNIRTFSAGGISVKTSAFSRDKSTGAWSNAFLGAYSGGLGVTDSSEGSGSGNTHTVDNSGRDNYVLFEFNQTVVVDSAFLGYVVGDSDLTIWIGSSVDPFNNHLVLSDSVMAGLGFTEVNLGAGSTRLADFNAGAVAGNVLVIAAKKGEADDYFKIEKLNVAKLEMGIYENIGKVVVGGVSDTDKSHYVNPECVGVTFAFAGNTAVSGTAGNIRTYTVNGVSVNASAFSRTTAGVWNTAYLGAYSEGLGVTDGSESGSNGTHRVDNVGRMNFVLFEFSTLVEIDRVFLNSVVTDSDVSIYIGTLNNPFHNHITLSDAVASAVTFSETNDTDLTTSRWADVNGDEVYGNFIVIAASVSDTTPDDQFKIEKMEVCAKAVKFYTVDSGSDDTFEYGPSGQALAHYNLAAANTNPRGVTTTITGNKVWVVDGNKIVYVYDQDGKSLGSWTANGLTTPEDITTNGTDIWVVDDGSNKVFRYSAAASRTSGNQSAASSFTLNSANTNAKGIVTDGTHLWVVNDAATAADKVFKYKVSDGSLVGSWTIDAANGSPTGITLNPGDVEHLWITDSADNAVYRYNQATTRTSGSQNAADVFQLAGGNNDVQGIADPPPGFLGTRLTQTPTQVAALTLPLDTRLDLAGLTHSTTVSLPRVRSQVERSSAKASQADRLFEAMATFAPSVAAAHEVDHLLADNLHESAGCDLAFDATDAAFGDFELGEQGNRTREKVLARN